MTGQSDTISRDFFDTNILVYAHDQRDPVKRRLALDIFANAVARDAVVVSAQVLGEFFNAATRRILNPISVEEAEDVIRLFSDFTVVALDLASGSAGGVLSAVVTRFLIGTR